MNTQRRFKVGEIVRFHDLLAVVMGHRKTLKGRQMVWITAFSGNYGDRKDRVVLGDYLERAVVEVRDSFVVAEPDVVHA